MVQEKIILRLDVFLQSWGKFATECPIENYSNTETSIKKCFESSIQNSKN